MTTLLNSIKRRRFRTAQVTQGQKTYHLERALLMEMGKRHGYTVNNGKPPITIRFPCGCIETWDNHAQLFERLCELHAKDE